MKALAFAWLALAAIVVPASCTIDHPSDALACTTQADCDATRTCTMGYCLVATTAMCPAGCNSCDAGARTCAIMASGNNKVTCPAGWSCTITCGNNGCGEVDCGAATACAVQCTGANSCDKVTCGAGRCTVTCGGTGSCNDVDCRNSCACDVSCAGSSSCNNARCPGQCTSGNGCSSQAPACNNC